MTKYFLLGYDSIFAFQQGGPIALAKTNDNYGLVKYDTDCMTINDLLDAVVGYDAYLEITIEEHVSIQRAKNIIEWREFIQRIDPDPENPMTDGELLDYIMENYFTPKFIPHERLL